MFHSVDSLSQYSAEQLEQALLKKRLDEHKSLTVVAKEYDIERECVFSVVDRSPKTDNSAFVVQLDGYDCEYYLTDLELYQLQYLIDIALGKVNKAGHTTRS
jgi:hypothetical protein